MSALAFLLIALLLSGIGSAVLVLRNRRSTSVESGIDEFRREMSALAPPEAPVRRRRPNRQAQSAQGSEPDLDEPGEPPSAEPSPEAEVATSDDDPGPSPADPRPRRPEGTSTPLPADSRSQASESAKLRPPDEPGAT